jgi:hypothetical protein
MGKQYPDAKVQQCTLDGAQDSSPATTHEQATNKVPEWNELTVEEQDAVIEVFQIGKKWRDRTKGNPK